MKRLVEAWSSAITRNCHRKSLLQVIQRGEAECLSDQGGDSDPQIASQIARKSLINHRLKKKGPAVVQPNLFQMACIDGLSALSDSRIILPKRREAVPHIEHEELPHEPPAGTPS